jgi:quercetin dioxygenase-like cupin family protein
VQDVRPPWIPGDARVLTVLIKHPPGSPGYPPHRVRGGPAFGYMIDGEMLFELEGQAPRVLRAGDAFWAPGGDLIHYRDANNRDDVACSFVLTMFRAPGQPLLEPVPEEELADRKGLHATQFEDTSAHRWRAETRELVLTEATATVAVHPAPSGGEISIALTGKALSNDLLLADSGNIALKAVGEASHPMRVVPMRLDMLSELPTIRVVGLGITEPTELRLVIELTARNPHIDAMSVITCECDSVLLDPQMPVALLDFQLQG